MINFSNVSRQLFEMAAGDGGRAFENQVPRLMQNIFPDRKFVQPSSQRVKTDLYEDKETGDPSDNVNYSIKYTRDNGNPSKVHQVNRNRNRPNDLAKGTFSKFNIGSRGLENFSRFAETLKGDGQDNKLIQAMLMRFGTNHLDEEGNEFSFPDFFEKNMDGRLNDAQRAVFNRVRNDEETPFVKAGELAQNFPRHHQAMMDHLDSNKNEIFDRMVRRNGNAAFGEAYDSYDPSNISRMIHRHVGDDFDEMSIRDVSDDKVKSMIDKMNWYGKGTHTYLAPEKTDDWNQRMLDITPWDYEASRWANNPSSSEFDEDERNWGARPGFMKATMGMDEEFVDQFFPKIWSGERKKGSSGNYLGDFNLNSRNEEVMNFNKLHFSESLEAEQASSEKATLSGEKQNTNIRRQRQKDQMAQKSPVSKSGVVYASEDYFRQIREGSKLMRAQDKARQDWRQDLEEHRGAPATEASDEGVHPYIRLMPKTNQIPQKKKEEKMKEIQSEQVSFEDALGSLIESEKPFDPDARRKQRAAMLKNAAKNAPKDTRTDAQKMADATGPRPGSNYRGD